VLQQRRAGCALGRVDLPTREAHRSSRLVVPRRGRAGEEVVGGAIGGGIKAGGGARAATSRRRRRLVVVRAGTTHGPRRRTRGALGDDRRGGCRRRRRDGHRPRGGGGGGRAQGEHRRRKDVGAGPFWGSAKRGAPASSGRLPYHSRTVTPPATPIHPQAPPNLSVGYYPNAEASRSVGIS
jgi:hypothetical protein